MKQYSYEQMYKTRSGVTKRGKNAKTLRISTLWIFLYFFVSQIRRCFYYKKKNKEKKERKIVIKVKY